MNLTLRVPLTLVERLSSCYYSMLTGYINFAGIFSESTALGLEFYGKQFPEFLQSARFVRFVVDVWKTLSLKNPSKGTLHDT